MTWNGEIKAVKVLGWVYTALGFVFFLLNITVLSAAMCAEESFRSIARLVMWPPLFFAPDRIQLSQAVANATSHAHPVWVAWSVAMIVMIYATPEKPKELRAESWAGVVALAVATVWIGSGFLPAIFKF